MTATDPLANALSGLDNAEGVGHLEYAVQPASNLIGSVLEVFYERDYIDGFEYVEDKETTATMGTFESHVRNAVHGVTEGWTYEMEVFYAHFPMQVSVEGEEVVIENFLGEKSPRRTEIRGDTEVEIDGEEITLRGPEKEAVGQTAAAIEQLTRVTDKDTRVFQDGVYITAKPSKGGAA